MNLYNRESVCIRESKLDQYDLIEISGFQIFTLNTIGKKKNRSGGIVILVKDNICKYVEIFNGSSNDVLWFRVKKKYSLTRIFCLELFILRQKALSLHREGR